jgi:hypothetical protein
MPEQTTIGDVISTVLRTRRILLTLVAFLLAGAAVGVLLALADLPMAVVLLAALFTQMVVVPSCSS